jgi:OOP family OmpA-OmpF porin
MRTSFIVGVLALTVAMTGAAEWASRRAARGAADTGPAITQTHQGPDAGRQAAAPAPVSEPATIPEAPPANPASSASADAAHTLVLAEGQGGFRLNAVSLSEDAMASIDEFVKTLDPEMVGVHVVIEGHTDNLGTAEVNRQIGLARAIAVREYLADEYQVPRALMRVVSYGADRPVADNATQDGRAQNRRVVITVLEDPVAAAEQR